MDIQTTKYLAIPILLFSTLLTSVIAICLQLYVSHRHTRFLILIQRIIACVTGGILLGTLLIFILPNCIDLVRQNTHDIKALHNFEFGYCLVGLGLFLICLLKEISRAYEYYSLNKKKYNEKEQLIISKEHQQQSDHCSIGQSTPQTPATITGQKVATTKEINERIFIFIFALGVHYFFNGVLVGGQTEISEVWLVLAAIVGHMSLVSFSVTTRLLVDNQNYVRVFWWMLLWSAMGSLGVILSLIIGGSSNGLNLINGILQCISAGTFFYVTFFDMLYNDLVLAKLYPFVNMSLVFIGYATIVTLSFWHQHPE